jgi:type II secretory pathway pseudopilin PulG
MTTRGEEGMTLIETLVGVSILGLIVAPISLSLMLGLMTSNGTRDKIVDSVASQLTSVYFIRDAQSADSIFRADPGLPLVGPATPCGSAGTLVVQMKWDNPAPASGEPAGYLASYRKIPNGTNNELWRYFCANDGTERDKVQLVPYLKTATIDCTPTCPSATESTPTSIRASLVAANTDSAGSSGYQEYSFRYEATRRALG